MKLASVNALHRYRIQIDAVETSDINGPHIRCCARTPKWEYSASRAEVILGHVRMEGIQRQVLNWSEKSEVLWFNAMNESAPTFAN